jgi:hypothetical protein
MIEEMEGHFMTVYDWTGQRVRRMKLVRTASFTMLLLVLMAIPALLLHYDLIHYPR